MLTVSTCTHLRPPPRLLRRFDRRILIRGGGECNTRRLVARYADACDLVASSLEDVAPKLDVLRTRCQAEVRDYDTIRKTAVYSGPVLDDLGAFLVSTELTWPAGDGFRVEIPQW